MWIFLRGNDVEIFHMEKRQKWTQNTCRNFQHRIHAEIFHVDISTWRWHGNFLRGKDMEMNTYNTRGNFPCRLHAEIFHADISTWKWRGNFLRGKEVEMNTNNTHVISTKVPCGLHVACPLGSLLGHQWDPNIDLREEELIKDALFKFLLHSGKLL